MLTIPLILGWLLDRWLGDPEKWPHPVVWFGRVIGVLDLRFYGSVTSKNVIESFNDNINMADHNIVASHVGLI